MLLCCDTTRSAALHLWKRAPRQNQEMSQVTATSGQLPGLSTWPDISVCHTAGTHPQMGFQVLTDTAQVVVHHGNICAVWMRSLGGAMVSVFHEVRAAGI